MTGKQRRKGLGGMIRGRCRQFSTSLALGIICYFFLFAGNAIAVFDAKLLPGDGAASDKFGYAISVSGDTIAVGSERDDDNGLDSGAAYIFERDPNGTGVWAEVVKVVAADSAGGDHFSNTLALDGDTLVVGSLLHDAVHDDMGTAYVFQRDQGGLKNWGQVKKLLPADGAAADHFGNAVAISGDVIAVGSWWNDANGSSSGAVYLFGRHQGGSDNWGQIAKITPMDGAASDLFGASVGLDGDVLAVGAAGDDDAAFNSGSVYIFYQNMGGPDNWGMVQKLSADDGAMLDNFGRYLSINGYTLVASSPYDDDAGDSSGSAYVFQRNVGGADNWGQVKKLTASDAAAGDEFGISVAVNGGTIAVGARYDDLSGDHGGSVYLFNRNQGGNDYWGEAETIVSPDGDAWDAFGGSVGLYQNTLVSGASGDNELGSGSGSAYVYTLYATLDPPVIEEVTHPGCVDEFATATLSVNAYDPFGGSLVYDWTALDGGVIAGAGPDVTFQPPAGEITPHPYRISLKVTSSATGLFTVERVALKVNMAGDDDRDGDVDGDDLYRLANTAPAAQDIAHQAANFGKSGVSCSLSSPQILRTVVSDAVVPLPVGIEQFPVTVTFDFFDPDLDLDTLHTTLVYPDGTRTVNAEPLWQEASGGTFLDYRIIDSSHAEGLYCIEVELEDLEGMRSGVHTVSFEVRSSAPKPLEIISLSPLSGGPGDTVQITGVGFYADEPWKNDVSFGALASAEVVSATGTEMVVVVPQGAMTGPVVVANEMGRTQSAASFTVAATMTIAPAATRMEVGQTTSFSCLLSGASSTGIIWSVDGYSDPDPSLGAITASGNYTAPVEVPDTVPVTIRCASADDPALFAEASVDIIAPPPLPGEGMVTAKTGGEMTSESGATAIVIPAQALNTDATVTVETLPPTSVAPPTSGGKVLAAASFDAGTATLAEPMTVSFQLSSWVEPGTVLQLEQQGAGVASGLNTVCRYGHPDGRRNRTSSRWEDTILRHLFGDPVGRRFNGVLRRYAGKDIHYSQTTGHVFPGRALCSNTDYAHNRTW
jgi:hypothetical protein